MNPTLCLLCIFTESSELCWRKTLLSGIWKSDYGSRIHLLLDFHQKSQGTATQQQRSHPPMKASHKFQMISPPAGALTSFYAIEN